MFSPSTSNAKYLFNCFSFSKRFASQKKANFVEFSRIIKSKEIKFPPRLPKIEAKKPKLNRPQKYEYLLVLDFEATCQESSLGPIHPIQEIIEFPVVQLCTKTWSEVRRFHEYVKPTENQRLSSFCTSLTGIIQEMVDKSPEIDQVLQNFHDWLQQDPNINLKSQNFQFVSCGDWDLKVALPIETNYKKIDKPDYFQNWINIKKSYATHTGHFARGMTHLLKSYDLQLKGRHHSGIDDVTNICEIVKCLGKDGHVFEVTSSTIPITKLRTFRDAKNFV